MSNGLVLSFFRRASQSNDWSQQELAEFYRVESALLQSGLSVTTDQGRSDEGDPWFVFCRADNDEVIAHFARVDHEYVVASCFHPVPARGRDFRSLIRDMLDLHPLMLPVRRRTGQKVFLHPSAMLLAMLASAYFLSNDKEVVSDHGGTGSESRSSLFSLLREKALIITALAVAWLEHHDDPALKSLGGSPFFHNSSSEKASDVVAASHDPHLINDLLLAQNFGLGAHRTLLQHASDHLTDGSAEAVREHTIQLSSTTPAPSHGNSSNIDLTAATLTDSSANNYSAGAGHTDSAVGGPDGVTGIQGSPPSPMGSALAVVMGEHESSASQPTSSGTEASDSVNSVVPNNDAFQITQLEISNSSTGSGQTIVLSTSPTTLGTALQQAFQQVGLDANHYLQTPLASADDASASHNVGADQSVQSSPVPAAEGSLNAVSSINPVPVSATSESGVSGFSGSAEVSQPLSLSTPANSQTSSTPPISTATPDNTATPNAQVVQEVATFLAHTPNYEITIAGANVVIVDTNLSDAQSHDFGVQTFDMSDGSTLSIVGIMQHLPFLSA